MAIVKLPADYPLDNPLHCSICQVELLLSKATAGFCDANNKQAFACVSHFSEVDLLIRGWADFIGRERYRYVRQGQEPKELTYMDEGVDVDVWLNS